MGTWGMIRGPARVERERAVKRDGIFFISSLLGPALGVYKIT